LSAGGFCANSYLFLRGLALRKLADLPGMLVSIS
jgi:hypothetical protein